MKTCIDRHRQDTRINFPCVIIWFQLKIRSQTAMVIRFNRWSTDCNYTNNFSGKHQSSKTSRPNHRTDGTLGPGSRWVQTCGRFNGFTTK